MTTERSCETCQDGPRYRCPMHERCTTNGYSDRLTTPPAVRAAVAEASELNGLRAALNRGSEMVDAARRDGVSPDVIASYCVPPAQTGVWNVTKPPQPVRGEANSAKPSEDLAGPESSKGVAARAVATNHADDLGDRPEYYTQGGVEAIDAIKAQLTPEGYEGFLRGQVAKYVWRLGRKGLPLSDARKALWYLERLKRELEGKP